MPISFAIPPALGSAFGLIPQQSLPASFTKYLGMGQVQGLMLSGRNPAPSTTGLSDIWGYPLIASGQQVRAFPAAPFTIAIISDSAADAAAGTGAQTVMVNYLDNNYLPWTALYTLNGQTAVTVATTVTNLLTGAVTSGVAVTNALRSNGMEVITAGTGLANAGNIYLTSSANTFTAGVPVTPSLVYDCILIGDNTDATVATTIPAGFQCMFTQFIPGISGNATSAIYGKVRVGITTANNGIFRGFDLGGVSNNNNPVPIVPSCFPIATSTSDCRTQCIVGASQEVSLICFGLLWPNV